MAKKAYKKYSANAIIEEKISGGRIIRPAYKNVAPLAEYVTLDER